MWTYSGDANLENGGVFYKLDPSDIQYGYCEAVRITPCSDAGCQDNAFWIERLTVNGFDDEKRIKNGLDCCGFTDNQPSDEIKAYALVCYGYYDVNSAKIVQIGRKDKYHGGEFITPDVVLRSNASLKNYVKKHFLNAGY